MSMIRVGLIGAVLLGGWCWSGSSHGAYITPVSVTPTGPVTQGFPGVIIDGITPPRGTSVTSLSVVSWNSTSTYFTIDFGSVQSVASLNVAVDNNDDYVIQSSVDGTTFSNLFTFLASDGPVSPAQGGLDLLSTNPIYSTSPTDLTTPAYVGRSFAATAARYLRISAANGDSVYGIGEVDAFTPNAVVPEPASITLAGIAGALGLVVQHCRNRGPRVA